MKYFGLCILSIGFLYSSIGLSTGYCDRFFDQGYEKGHRIGHDKGYQIGYDKGQKTYDCKKERHQSYNKGYGEGIKHKGGYDGGYKTGYDTGYKKGQSEYPDTKGGFCAFVFKFDGFIVLSEDQCESSGSCDDDDGNTIDVCLVGQLEADGPLVELE